MDRESVNYFNKNNYIVVKDFISEEMSSFLYNYVKLSSNRLNWAKQNIPDLNVKTFGQFPDLTGSYGSYGDITFDTLLMHKLTVIEIMTGKKLLPTYSYFRLYIKGSELVKHIDRPSCEISTTLNLGGDPWPIFIDGTGADNVIDEYKNIHKPNAPAGTKVLLEVGDMLVYSGCELEHWREPFDGNICGQVFLHYNHVNGPFANKNRFDGRPMLGLPSGVK